MQAEHIECASLCSRLETVIFVYVCNACMLAAEDFMHVAYIFQELRYCLHDVQLALHKKDRNKGSKMFFVFFCQQPVEM